MLQEVEIFDVSSGKIDRKQINLPEIDHTEINKINQIQQKTIRLAELTKDFAQVQAGLIIDDLEDRKAEFRTLLNEVRVLQGKQPREINGG